MVSDHYDRAHDDKRRHFVQFIDHLAGGEFQANYLAEAEPQREVDESGGLGYDNMEPDSEGNGEADDG